MVSLDPELARICLIMISGLIAVGLCPIGLYWLFPVKDTERKLSGGLSLLMMGVVGVFSFGALLFPR